MSVELDDYEIINRLRKEDMHEEADRMEDLVACVKRLRARDSSSEMVAEFHRAFDCHIEERPKLFFPNESGEDYIREWVERFRDGAEELKASAEHYKALRFGETALMVLRMQLALEELAEHWEAFLEKDIAKLFGELLDRQYVLDGDFHVFGLASKKLEGMRALHARNMAKLGEDGKPMTDPSGRVLKPEGWEPVDWETVLGDHIYKN